MSILARLNKQSEDGEESSDTVLEKYWETKRELETLRQRVGSEFEDEIERLESAKRSVEKKVCVCVCMYVHMHVCMYTHIL